MKTRIGLDLVEISRFKKHAKKGSDAFLNKVFTEGELEYCFKHQDPSPHLAGLFAAKEATSKALGVAKYPFAEIEIRHAPDGQPIPYFKGKKLQIGLSITHTRGVAAAVAIA